jgi:hypothetical protein
MSKLEVDAIEPQSGTTLTLGASGDAVNIASGASITDFKSTGIDDNATSTAITIDSSENVGIGENSPGALLHIKPSSGNSVFRIESANTSECMIEFADPEDTNVGRIKYDHISNYMQFITNASERMRINSSGSVGIGTPSPGTVPLNVVATDGGNVDEILELRNNSTTAGTGVRLRLVTSTDAGSTNNSVSISSYRNASNDIDLLFETSSTERMRINSSGHVIAPDLNTTGTTSNRYPLYWVFSGTTGSIEPYTGSVREMKTDINDMSSVDWIYSLRLRSFKFRDFETNEDGSRTYLETTNNEPNTEYGLIAEEVNEVNGSDYILDKQIDEDGNENLKGVLYHNLVPILLKALQKQQTKIQELEARITALENA